MAASTANSAILFPGQGSQTAGMAAVTAAHRPDLLAQAREELGADPFERIGDGTHLAQPAIYCASLAHWRQAGSPRGAMFAGHSLGELAALVAGGALDAASGLRLAVLRGRLMEDAAAARPGGMMAVLGGEDEAVRALAALHELTVANENAPGQVVLSGAAEALTEARREARAEGLKAIRLPVAGAFHSPLMAGAASAFEAALAEVEFAAPELPVFSSTAAAPFVVVDGEHTAAPFVGADVGASASAQIRAGLVAALTEPVLWQATLVRMRAAGAEVFLETGPGDVLTGLVRRTLDGVEARSLAEQEAAHV